MAIRLTKGDDDSAPRYRRVLLKISGEALMGKGEYGLESETVTRIA
ncbi:MAG: UMP kinase, partial [Rhodospirillaceae bacterium]